ncbi:MAG: TonB C-terminal domain-containing protein, partial [Epsilonproteobacteria bacterium]|nr:TonB C-terminal domain-containing protein [Campylobacterota bacterium]
YVGHFEEFKRLKVEGEAVEVYIQTPKKSPKPSGIRSVAGVKNRGVKKTVKKSRSGSRSAKQSVQKELRDLFASLDAKKITSKKTISTPPPNRPSRKRGESARELLQKLSFKEYTLEDASRSVKAVEGVVDPYLQKVYRILYENWMPSQLSAGNWAKVRIVIDEEGDFFYQVLQWSKNEAFNDELRRYLEYLETIRFPVPEKRRSIVVRFEAKE